MTAPNPYGCVVCGVPTGRTRDGQRLHSRCEKDADKNVVKRWRSGVKGWETRRRNGTA